MSARDKALIGLRLIVQVCAHGLKALSEGRKANDGELDVMMKDYQSLLTLVYSSTTKISLVLKPGEAAYSAAIPPLNDLRGQTDALASCACGVNGELHGKELAVELRQVTEGVVGAVQGLANEFLGDGERYLFCTGAVHEMIERARGVSKTNAEAAKKRWDRNADTIADAVRDLEEVLNPDQDVDDGWGELGLEEPEIGPEEIKEALELIKQARVKHEAVAGTKELEWSDRLVEACDEVVVACMVGAGRGEAQGQVMRIVGEA